MRRAGAGPGALPRPQRGRCGTQHRARPQAAPAELRCPPPPLQTPPWAALLTWGPCGGGEERSGAVPARAGAGAR